MRAIGDITEITLPPPAEGEIVDPACWFNSPGLLEVEIGCGKGGFLLHRARSHPELRLLGIEWANKFYKYCADRMRRWGVTNVRVMRTDARPFFLYHLPDRCVSVLHLYHPDPWPKKRHHKRRLVQPEFASAVARVLMPGGCWLIQTDHAEYYAHMLEVIEGQSALRSIDWTDAGAFTKPDWTGTNYEIKYARQGRGIHRAACVRA